MSTNENPNKDSKKNDILKRMSSVEVTTKKCTEEELRNNYIKVSLSELAAEGANLIPFGSVITEALKNKQLDQGEYYRLSIKPNAVGSLKMNGNKTIGNMVGADGHTISSRAEFIRTTNVTKTGIETIACVEMAAISVMLVAIIASLNDIKENQSDTDFFIHANKKAELDGNFSYLTELMNDLKYNLDNQTFMNNAHVKALDIKSSSKQCIILYVDEIKSILGKKKTLITNQDGDKVVDSIKKSLTEYQKAVQVYAFSTYLEILCLGNFNADYLEKGIKQINEYANEYRKFFTKLSNIVEELYSSTIQANATKAVSDISSTIGELLNKTPIIDKTPLDDLLIKNGENIRTHENHRINESVKEFGNLQSANVAIFANNIQLIKEAYNTDTDMIADENNLYFPKEKPEQNMPLAMKKNV